ncbi:hypothetical protein llap_12484 [Limosa lapponica baueri]|uniref:Uncharacterized protein n=1 Tax=Limosa lapponica baueri TaxID=1758121 RepID=A0A2I0TTU5_LIMLA|nr:hypothetical protein llap_12484 [Limosa lapponica baueri]
MLPRSELTITVQREIAVLQSASEGQRQAGVKVSPRKMKQSIIYKLSCLKVKLYFEYKYRKRKKKKKKEKKKKYILKGTKKKKKNTKKKNKKKTNNLVPLGKFERVSLVI